MGTLGLCQTWLRSRAAEVRSSVILIVVFLVGFVAARFWPDHTATPRRISGAVTWSNADSAELLFEADNDSDDSGQYQWAVAEWFNTGGTHYMGDTPGLPCYLGRGCRTD